MHADLSTRIVTLAISCGSAASFSKLRATALQQELLTFLGGDPSATLAAQPTLSALQLSLVKQALDDFPAAVSSAIETLDLSKRKGRSERRH